MMTADEIAARLHRIENETDLSIRAQRVATLVAAQFRRFGYETAVVGGSAIEFYTAGDYMSGDVDLAFVGKTRPEPRMIAEVLSPLGVSTGSIRTFKIGGIFVDVLGELDTFKIGGIFVDVLGELDTWANTPLRELVDENGDALRLIQPEDLLPHRILVATYPTEQPKAMEAARKLLAVCLQGKVVVDWEEMHRVAALPAYKVADELVRLINDLPA